MSTTTLLLVCGMQLRPASNCQRPSETSAKESTKAQATQTIKAGPRPRANAREGGHTLLHQSNQQKHRAT
ncbi:hypothetical protein EX30DRAFT_52910 [Ascodesmis nigricans]|uniref:Uncharacterized protein n=1 Tax=Ascodesmis nigricans TaxID=341454 RepID=A0A4S2MV89_9PEZI|nr:hypothetical protein EX30DRAFT_52910 [Ascodesmis nigricans]